VSAEDESTGVARTSEGATQEERLALNAVGFLRRALAAVVDHMLFAPLMAIWVVPLLERGFSDSPPRLAALEVLMLAYSAIMLHRYGQTVGMMALGMRVVRTDGSALEGREVLTRTVAYWAPVLLVAGLRYWGMWLVAAVLAAGWWIGLFWVIVDWRRQGYHDKIAGTVVVFERRQRALGGRRPAC